MHYCEFFVADYLQDGIKVQYSALSPEYFNLLTT